MGVFPSTIFQRLENRDATVFASPDTLVDAVTTAAKIGSESDMQFLLEYVVSAPDSCQHRIVKLATEALLSEDVRVVIPKLESVAKFVASHDQKGRLLDFCPNYSSALSAAFLRHHARPVLPDEYMSLFLASKVLKNDLVTFVQRNILENWNVSRPSLALARSLEALCRGTPLVVNKRAFFWTMVSDMLMGVEGWRHSTSPKKKVEQFDVDRDPAFPGVMCRILLALHEHQPQVHMPDFSEFCTQICVYASLEDVPSTHELLARYPLGIQYIHGIVFARIITGPPEFAEAAVHVLTTYVPKTDRETYFYTVMLLSSFGHGKLAREVFESIEWVLGVPVPSTLYLLCLQGMMDPFVPAASDTIRMWLDLAESAHTPETRVSDQTRASRSSILRAATAFGYGDVGKSVFKFMEEGVDSTYRHFADSMKSCGASVMIHTQTYSKFSVSRQICLSLLRAGRVHQARHIVQRQRCSQARAVLANDLLRHLHDVPRYDRAFKKVFRMSKETLTRFCKGKPLDLSVVAVPYYAI
jgi:hypothetical protein